MIEFRYGTGFVVAGAMSFGAVPSTATDGYGVPYAAFRYGSGFVFPGAWTFQRIPPDPATVMAFMNPVGPFIYTNPTGY